ncbi:Fn3 associated [Lachnospiraceae bacterium KH1T2]|nr:Fn3 associated [Lachnospiraceae bacterium KH1T2]
MKSIRKHLILILFLILSAVIGGYAVTAKYKFTNDSRKSVKINEVCTSNLASCFDENGKHPDWIELYNTSNEDVDLSGWYLSNAQKKLDKWRFPDGTTISANGFLVVYADGTEEQKEDPDAGFSLTSLIMTGRASEIPSNGLHTTFKLSANDENLFLSANDKSLIDSVEVPQLKYDTSWGRVKDGVESFSRLTPTAGNSNDDADKVVYATLAKPVFSKESGFYEEPFKLKISSEEDAEIHYTLDGSVPTKDSPLYDGEIEINDSSSNENIYSALQKVSVDLLDYVHYIFSIPDKKIDKCTVVRAAAFFDDGEISETSTASYFVGFDKKKGYDGIGVISLVSDPDDLFSDEKGIYVIGDKGKDDFKKRLSASEDAVKYIEDNPSTPTDGTVSICGIKMDEYIESNYIQAGSEWEREAYASIFDSSHELISEENLGIRVKGHRTRNFPKKSLNLYARKIYGDGSFKANLLGMNESAVSLFSGGQDELTIAKDAIIAELTADLNFTSLRFSKPYYVFLDGEFWGVYRISSKVDKDYIQELYGVDDDEVIIAKNKLLNKGSTGDEEIYGSLKNFINHADFTTGTDYERFQEMVDLDSLIDYYAARLYVDEGMDWPNLNTSLWRTRESDGEGYGDGRWRWINFDNNSNISYDSVSTNTLDIILNGSKHFKRDEMMYKLMQNKDFCKRFYERFLVIANETYDPERCIEVIDKYAAETRKYMNKDYERFYGTRYDSESFENDIESMKKYFMERSKYIIPCVKEACGQ